jgi:hypothetical protein
MSSLAAKGVDTRHSPGMTMEGAGDSYVGTHICPPDFSARRTPKTRLGSKISAITATSLDIPGLLAMFRASYEKSDRSCAQQSYKSPYYRGTLAHRRG